MKFLHFSSLLTTCLLGTIYAKNNEIYYNKNEILSETHWKDVSVMPNAPLHLSVLSQGKFNEGLYSKYDKNYYYPASAGEDVDIFVFDEGFNYTYDEFSDINARCEIIVENGKVSKPDNDKVCFGYFIYDHGTLVSSAAAGKFSGVAKKANIHGVLVKEKKEDMENNIFDDIIAGLKYIKDNGLIKPNKTLFNFSIGYFTTVNEFETGEKYREAQKLINEIIEMGGVIVAAADNIGGTPYDVENDRVKYPCAFDNVICVGGIGSFKISGLEDDIVDSSYYTLETKSFEVALEGDETYSIDLRSDTGAMVDLYAPFTFHYHGSATFDFESGMELALFGVNVFGDNTVPSQEVENAYFIKDIDAFFPGNSFASPIVVGVAATLMSEFPEKKFNYQTILDYLREIGEKDIIHGLPEEYPSLFINNGKKIIYDADLNPMEEDPSIFEEETISVGNDNDSEIEENIDSELDSNDEQE